MNQSAVGSRSNDGPTHKGGVTMFNSARRGLRLFAGGAASHGVIDHTKK